jgi:nicotinate-nucleotide pyrophosphorylase (carboxylating)
VSHTDLNDASFTEELLQAIRTQAELAKAEDLGAGDLTGMLLEPEDQARFELLLKQPAVLAGRAVAAEVLAVYDESIEIEWNHEAREGARFDQVPVRLARLTGPNRSILAAERVLLNFLQRLCGVATLTRKYVDAVAGTGARIFDTRKTTPGWRWLEKYAVRCGGGHNHRMGLYDAVLVKDNHLAGIELGRLPHAIFEMLTRAAAFEPPPKFIEVEADTPQQVEELFKVVGIHVILLDNFGLDDLRRVVQRRDALELKGKIELEASGGVALGNVAEVARTGVDRISVGAITHSATAVDLSLARL